MNGKRLACFSGSASCVVVLAATLHSAYRGHADDRDVNALLSAYPALKNTPADSCATCHSGGVVKRIPPGEGMRDENHCDYCHAVFVRDKKDVRETLNRFGRAYLAAGRSAAAVTALAAKDSDGDGASDEAELKAGTNPGDASSSPARPAAPSRALTVAALKSLVPPVDQVLFLNSTKSRIGRRVQRLPRPGPRGRAAGRRPARLGGERGPAVGRWLRADVHARRVEAGLAARPRRRWAWARRSSAPCGWVTYASRRLEPGKPLPPAKVLLAFEENGQPLEKARFEAETGRLLGKGPFRAVVPQFVVSPPDLPLTADPSCPPKVAAEHRFHEEYDHNAGASQNAVVAIRVKPLPKGTRDIDWQTTALKRLAAEEVVFFGAIR